MAYFLGIDLGASSLKACLIDETGKRVAMARAPFSTYLPMPGHAEQKPDDWRKAMLSACAELNDGFGKAMENIAAISFSGGAHIGVLCDYYGTPLADAIMWSDQRAADDAERLSRDKHIETVTGNRPNATWTLPQLIWLRRHQPELIKATQKLFFAKDWLSFQLTGIHISDPSEAVGSLMADKSGKWHADCQSLSGIPISAFPPLCAPMTHIGNVTSEASTLFGLKAETPVYQGAIDTSMEWLCAAPVSRDMASLKLASAGVLAFTTDKTTCFPPVSYYPHIIAGLSYHAAGMSDCMGAIDWIRQNFTPQLDAEAFAGAAAKAPAGAEGLLFYPYLSGARAPFWDANLTAELNGLTRAHNEHAIARAAFEGVGHVLTAIWFDMTDRLNHRPDSLHVLGGGGQYDFFCQMLADMMGVNLLRSQEHDSAFAAALLAATAAKAFTELPKAAKTGYDLDRHFVPDSIALKRYAVEHENFMVRHVA